MDYSSLLERSVKIPNILTEKEWKRMDLLNEKTGEALTDLHISNMEQNIKSGLWSDHGPLSYGLYDLGKNKAVVGIGAGPSYNLNSDTLKRVHDYNTLHRLDDQPFVLTCSNHQFRKCLKSGIVPHFVVIVDSGEVLLDHLIRDIPNHLAKNCILLTGLHTSPKVLNAWHEKGRPILFYVQKLDQKQQKFKDLTGEDPEPFLCEEGGNVLNMMWIYAIKFLHSSIFMALGNDLSFPVADSIHERRKAFYADGEYGVNIKNKRDEAKSKLTWMGFKFDFNPIINQWVINLEPLYTSWQLWVYKKWQELQVAFTSEEMESFHYFNCSERGILGMLCRDENEDMLDKSNWMLMDELYPTKWHTRRFEDAVEMFLRTRELIWQGSRENQGVLIGANDVTGLVRKVPSIAAHALTN